MKRARERAIEFPITSSAHHRGACAGAAKKRRPVGRLRGEGSRPEFGSEEVWTEACFGGKRRIVEILSALRRQFQRGAAAFILLKGMRATPWTVGPETVKSMKRTTGRTSGRGSKRGSGRSSIPKGLEELSQKADEAIQETKVEITNHLKTQVKNGVPGSMKMLVDLAKLRMGAEAEEEDSDRPGVSRAAMWSKELEDEKRRKDEAGAGELMT